MTPPGLRPTSALGKLFGVGVGPGASDLMTLRAVRVLQEAQVLAIPRQNQWSESFAWRIAKPVVGDVPGQERLMLTFPMTRDPEILRPAWDEALREIGARLERGLSVAFLTQGDPFVYSTFIYLHEEAPRRWPGVEIEVVPAVSSITAVPHALGIPLADGEERVAILPAMYDVEDLKEILDRFDTVLLFKVRSVLARVVEILEEKGLLDRAWYVSKATTREERVVEDLASLASDRCDYFSMVMIAKKSRAGALLRGKT